MRHTVSLQGVNSPPLRGDREWRGMNRKEALRQLRLGSSVAESDDDLQDYFVETESFRSLIRGDGDIVAGDKGTGKSAIFKILAAQYENIPELKRVDVIPAFNTGG